MAARRDDSEELADAWAAIRRNEVKTDIHIAECAILRKEITSQLRSLRNVVVGFGSAMFLSMVTAMGFLLDKLLFK